MVEAENKGIVIRMYHLYCERPFDATPKGKLKMTNTYVGQVLYQKQQSSEKQTLELLIY